MNAVGFDLSYSRSGFCQIWSDPDTGEVRVLTDKFKTLPGTPLIPRTGLIKEWVFDCLLEAELDAHLDIIIFENAVFGGLRASMLGGLSMGVLLPVYETYIYRGPADLLLVPPPTLKRSAGVKGKAKSLMIDAFKELNPDFGKVCDDEADAYFLARLGVDYITSSHGGTIPKLAQDVLFSEELTKVAKPKPGKRTPTKPKVGKPRGLALRTGEFFYKGIRNGVQEKG